MRCLLLLALILLAAACTTNQRRHGVDSPALAASEEKQTGRALCDLSAKDADAAWKLYSIQGVKNDSRLFASGGALHVVSNDAAGLFYFTGAPLFDPAKEPLLTWRWRVSDQLPDATPLSPDLDNFPARLLVGFDSGWEGADSIALQWKKKVEDATGQTPPPRAICYTFGGRLPQSEAVDALFGQGRIVVINLRGREAAPGQWYEEVRDVASDYKAIFGQTAPKVTALAIAADTHRVHATVTADFADFRVYEASAYAQFSQDLTAPPQREWSNAAIWIVAGSVVVALACGAWLVTRMQRRTR
jgi:hypothetical protein